MNLNHLAYFRVLGITEHYTKAANDLNITQPSLSHAIRALEEDLGTQLFEKQGRNVKLTKYGKAFHSIVDKALAELEAGEKQLRTSTTEHSGQVDLAFIHALGFHYIPQFMKGFKELYDHEEITFTFAESTTSHIIQGLKDKKYDIGFCSYAAGEPDICFTKIYEEPLIAIVPTTHRFASFETISLNVLNEDPVIYYDKTSELRQTVDGMFKEAEIIPNITYELAEDSAIAGLVSVGQGIAIVPDTPILNSFPIKKVAISSLSHSHSIYIATLKNRYLTPSAYTFYNYLVNPGETV